MSSTLLHRSPCRHAPWWGLLLLHTASCAPTLSAVATHQAHATVPQSARRSLTADESALAALKEKARAHSLQAEWSLREASAASNVTQKPWVFGRALVEFQAAANAWSEYLQADLGAEQAHEATWQLAKARHGLVAVLARQERPVSSELLASALAAARSVRDSSSQSAHRQPAAELAIELADDALELQYQAYERTGGETGVPRRREVDSTNAEDRIRVRKVEMPDAVRSSVAARDEYVARISPEQDPLGLRWIYATEAARALTLYGELRGARQRLLPVYREQCNRTRVGFEAWSQLLTLANLAQDPEESRHLFSHACCHFPGAPDPRDLGPCCPITSHCDSRLSARVHRRFDAAFRTPAGPQQRRALLQVAAQFQREFETTPPTDAGPSGIWAAEAYRRAGHFDEAVLLYQRILNMVDAEQRERSPEPERTPATTIGPTPAAPLTEQKRHELLFQARWGLAEAHRSRFEYDQAKLVWQAIAADPRHETAERRRAARRWLRLEALSADSAAVRARQQLAALSASAAEMAEADLQLAMSVPSPALAAFDRIYRRYRLQPGAQLCALRAAYLAAKQRQHLGRDDALRWWCQVATAAASWATYRAAVPPNSGAPPNAETPPNVETPCNWDTPTAEEMHAEAAFRTIAPRIDAALDGSTILAPLTGSTRQVRRRFGRNVRLVDQLNQLLVDFLEHHPASDWATTARVKQAMLHDRLLRDLRAAQPTPDRWWARWRWEQLDRLERITVRRFAGILLRAADSTAWSPELSEVRRRLAVLEIELGEQHLAAQLRSGRTPLRLPADWAQLYPGRLPVVAPEPLPLPTVFPEQGVEFSK